MLAELHVYQYALIEELHLTWSQGFNVLTGETGAGKSIVIGALGALLGARASADVIRSGAESARVEAVFQVGEHGPVAEALQRLELWEDGGMVILTRELSRSGRHRCRINGRLVSLGLLGEVGRLLVEIHGQHENQALLRPDVHLDLLDAFAGPEVGQLRREVQAAYRRVQQASAALRELEDGARERARRLDLLAFQIAEIEEANLQPGEDEALLAERQRLLHAQRLREELAACYSLLYEGTQEAAAAVDVLGECASRLGAAARLDQELAPLASQVEALAAQLQELARALRRYQEGLVADPQRLEQVEARLELITRLKKKYGSTIPEVLSFAEDCRRQHRALEGSEERADALRAELARLSAELAERSARLSRARRQAAQRLSARVEGELAELGMQSARLSVSFGPVTDGVDAEGGRVGPRGADQIEFLLAANPGEGFRPLARSASGGELARVMLALRTVLQGDEQGVPTQIFDEVDAGIGGRTAHAVGERLARLAAQRQVICITHLAQVASFADGHFAVEKYVTDGRTTVVVRPVQGHDRLAELARMLGGRVTDTTLEHARELLAVAQTRRQLIRAS